MPAPRPANHLPVAEVKKRLLAWALRFNQYPLFKGCAAKLEAWFVIVERACVASGIPRSQFTEAALTLIVGALEEAMKIRHEKFLELSGEGFWKWEEFKADFKKIVEVDKSVSLKTWLIAIAGVGLVVAGVCILFPAVGISTLNIVGFQSAGVAKGSIAALIQSVFYGGSTGGIFSTFQMLGATLVLPALETWIGGLLATGVGTAALKYTMDRLRQSRIGL